MSLSEEARKKQREYMREYRKRNRNKLKEYNRKYREKKLEDDPDYFRRINARYWERKAEQNM